VPPQTPVSLSSSANRGESPLRAVPRKLGALYEARGTAAQPLPSAFRGQPRPGERRAAATKECICEADISTIEYSAQAHAWFSCAHGHRGRAQCDSPPPAKGAQAAVGVAAHPYDHRTCSDKRALTNAQEHTTKLPSMTTASPRPNRFPRAERITRRRDYLHAYAHGRKRVGAHFVCFTERAPETGRRLGLAVSKKVGNAVTRNRVKRHIREMYRTHRDRLPEDVSIVVIARPQAAKLDGPSAAQSLRRVFEAEGLLRG